MQKQPTNKTYFSPEMQMAYMGSSQFKAFQRCEAAALAEITGEYSRPVTTSMLIGSYIDAWYAGEMDDFKAEHPEAFKRDGGLKSEFVQAEVIIRRLEQDRLYSLLMSGKKQVVRTGTIAGVPFKIKIDSYLGPALVREIIREFPDTAASFVFCDGAIVDQKIMRDMEDVWLRTERRYVSFIEAWGYDVQGAIYQAVEGNALPFILAVGTKEAEPNIGAFTVPDGDLAAKLYEVEDHAPRYQAIKMGLEEPRACGLCPYCRSQKRLTKIISYKEIPIC